VEVIYIEGEITLGISEYTSKSLNQYLLNNEPTDTQIPLQAPFDPQILTTTTSICLVYHLNKKVRGFASPGSVGQMRWENGEGSFADGITWVADNHGFLGREVRDLLIVLLVLCVPESNHPGDLAHDISIQRLDYPMYHRRALAREKSVSKSGINSMRKKRRSSSIFVETLGRQGQEA
jgi:hypothetical protein